MQEVIDEFILGTMAQIPPSKDLACETSTFVDTAVIQVQRREVPFENPALCETIHQ